MRGLFLKDMYVIKMHGFNIVKIAGLILLLTELMALSVRCGNLKVLYNSNEEIETGIFPIIYIIIACLFLCGCIFYEIADCDEKSEFKNMLRSMPTNNNMIVMADYGCLFGITLVTLIVSVLAEICFIITLNIDMKWNYVYVIIAIFITYWILQCLLIPFTYVNSKAPLIAAGVLYLIVMGIAVALSTSDNSFGFSTVKNIYKWIMRLSEIILPVVTLASYKVAVAIAKRRRYAC